MSICISLILHFSLSQNMLEPGQLHQGSQYRQRPESTGMAETAVQIRRSHHHRSHLYTAQRHSTGTDRFCINNKNALRDLIISGGFTVCAYICVIRLCRWKISLVRFRRPQLSGHPAIRVTCHFNVSVCFSLDISCSDKPVALAMTGISIPMVSMFAAMSRCLA